MTSGEELMASPKGHRQNAKASAGPTAEALRVVLIGRTGLDAKLRLDPAIELIRARTALDAVGEVAEGMRHNDDMTTVAVVAAGSDPGSPASEDGPEDPGKRREFLAALRRVDPKIRVLRLEGSDGRIPEEYDGMVKANAGGDDIRAALGGRNGADNGPQAGREAPQPQAARSAAPSAQPRAASTVSDAQPVAARVAPPPEAAKSAASVTSPPSVPAVTPVPPVPSASKAEATASAEPEREAELPLAPQTLVEHEELSTLIDTLSSGKASAADNGDEVLVRLLLQGRDITDAAMEIIRRRLGGRDAVFVTPGDGPAAAARPGSAMGGQDGPVMHESSVAWRGRMLGRLRSRDVPAEELALQASWLAAWMVLRDQHAQLREAAFADPLTGAHNRRYFDQFLRLAMDEAKKERRGVTLLMFDIDDFKQFNDRYGHAAGDEILRETVRLLRSVIRPSDKVCRIGGDEFAVVFHEPTGPRTPSSRPPTDVCQIAERFQRAIGEHKFPKLGREAPGRLTISGGLATYPWDGTTPETLLARADELAIQSKRSGKNCIAFGPGAEDVQRPPDLTP